MTEAALHNLLTSAQWRLRWIRALSAAWGALTVALFASAAIVAGLRWSGRVNLDIFALTLFPLFVASLAAGAAVVFARINDMRAASLLDRNAGLADYLTTWLFLKRSDDSTLTPVQRGFRDAQTQTTLDAASAIDLRKNLPIVWPAWSRVLWLALILLLSAILTPPRSQDGISTSARSAAAATSVELSGSANRNAAPTAPREAPRVQVLSPGQMRKLELVATDPQLPQAVKQDALKELNAAIGGIAESDLTADVRELLDMLRKDAGVPTSVGKSDGALSVNAASEDIKPHAAKVGAAEYKAFENVDQAWAASEQNFGDVRAQLNRYYRHKE